MKTHKEQLIPYPLKHWKFLIGLELNIIIVVSH